MKTARRLLMGMVLVMAQVMMAEPNMKLLAVVRKGCSHCERWESEVYYDFKHWKQSLHQGDELDLKVLDVAEPKHLERYRHLVKQGKMNPAQGTPTFYLMVKGRSVCQITGYSSSVEFIQSVNGCIDRANNQ